MERRPIRCAIYTRQSVARANDSGLTSCEAQRDICGSRVRANALQGWVALEERFDDVGESQWDGRKDKFTAVLDETAIAEEHAKLKMRDEHANRTKPRARSSPSQTASVVWGNVGHTNW